MKKILIFCLLVSTFTLYAQTEKGSFAIGLHNFNPKGIDITGLPLDLFGNGSGLGFSFGSSRKKINGENVGQTEKLYTGGLSTSFHYFIQDDFSLGVNGSIYTGFTAYHDASNEQGRYSARIFMLGPKVRYYLGNGKTKVWLKGSASMGLLNVWWNRKKDNNPVKLSQIGGGAGASIFLSRHVSVDLGMEYNQFTVKTNERMKNISTNLALDIGFGIFF